MPPKLKRSIGKGAPIDKYRDGLDSVSLQQYKEKIQMCMFHLISLAKSQTTNILSVHIFYLPRTPY